MLPGRNEGRSKSTFRQLRISTLWTSKGYEIDSDIYHVYCIENENFRMKTCDIILIFCSKLVGIDSMRKPE